jgi:hypothetical protein
MKQKRNIAIVLVTDNMISVKDANKDAIQND